MRIIMLSMMISLSGCAVIAKNDQQPVVFRSVGKASIQAPGGNIEIQNGYAMASLERSRKNVTMIVTCNGTTKPIQVATRFDWLIAGAGNILNGGWGWLIDPFADKAYDYPKEIDVSLACPASETVSSVSDSSK